MTRMIVLLSVFFLGFASPAFSGGKEEPCNYPGYKDGACDGDQDDGDVPGKPGHPGHGPGHGHPGHGFPGHGGHHFHGACAGGFQGFYGNGAPVAFLIQQVGYQLQVQAWYGYGTYYGTGLCTQLNAWQASFELYFPGAPIHRGVISNPQRGLTVMEGQLDFHYGFQLQRTR